jgi:hypothetical protein
VLWLLVAGLACSDEASVGDNTGGSDDASSSNGGAATTESASSANGASVPATGTGGGGTTAQGGAGQGGGAPQCDPPNTVLIGDRCVPSCGVAGGNQCVGATSTMCEGLPHLESHDCEVCCARPNYPAPAPASFHFTYQSSLTYWDSILAMSATHPSVAFVSAAKPPQIGPERWAAYLSYRSNPQPTAADVNQLLIDPVNGPRWVMFEELHNAESNTFFAQLATDLHMNYPQWDGRWGIFIGFGNYPAWSSAIDAVQKANGILSLELYPSQTEYCASGTNGGQRDIWLSEQFIGNANLGRLNWLIARKALNNNSQSFITPLFGVGDVLLNGQSPAIFLDRMFYVWMTRTNQPSMISAANGGPGAYKWQNVAETPLGYGVGNTSRDLAFSESFNHYSVNGLTTSRLGPVPCP